MHKPTDNNNICCHQLKHKQHIMKAVIQDQCTKITANKCREFHIIQQSTRIADNGHTCTDLYCKPKKNKFAITRQMGNFEPSTPCPPLKGRICIFMLIYPAGARSAPAGPKGQKAPKGPFGPLGQSACFGAGCYIEMATSCH